METVPLNKLNFGGDLPGGGVNVRTACRDEGMGELGASILAHGIIQPLAVRTVGAKVYVVDGNRRLKAMRMLSKDKRLDKAWPVKVAEIDDGTNPVEASLAANIMQLPMHEVDQYEAFAKLAADGKSAVDIASSFGTSELMVNRRLALGKLSPVLRDAWREGKMSTESAQAFTVTTDHELQQQVYTSLAKGQMLYRHSIVRALLHSDQANASDLRFVGKKAYLAAGGRLLDDLFADESHILDPDLLKRLARDKVDAECKRLVDEGWGWASLATDLLHERYRWPKIEIVPAYTEEELFRLEELAPKGAQGKASTQAEFREAEMARDEVKAIETAARYRSISALDKARSGCALHIGYDGKLSVDFGLIRPGNATQDATASVDDAGTAAGMVSGEATATEHEAGAISGALAETLSEQMTIAAAVALAEDPDLALRVVVAALQAHYRSPARIVLDGWPGLQSVKLGSVTYRTETKRPTFAEALALTERSSRAHLLVELAALVAPSLDLTEGGRQNSAKAIGGQRELIDAIDPASYLDAARKAFDADAFFARAPAAVAVEAVAEMGGAKPKGKKSEIAIAAAALARHLGWLPPMMRSSHYVPPRADSGPQAPVVGESHCAGASLARRRSELPADDLRHCHEGARRQIAARHRSHAAPCEGRTDHNHGRASRRRGGLRTRPASDQDHRGDRRRHP